jgi:hypothetical protein
MKRKYVLAIICLGVVVALMFWAARSMIASFDLVGTY